MKNDQELLQHLRDKISLLKFNYSAIGKIKEILIALTKVIERNALAPPLGCIATSLPVQW